MSIFQSRYRVAAGGIVSIAFVPTKVQFAPKTAANKEERVLTMAESRERTKEMTNKNNRPQQTYTHGKS